MARASKYPAELRERAGRIVSESQRDHSPEFETIKTVAAELGIGSAETLRKWVRQAEVDAKIRHPFIGAEPYRRHALGQLLSKGRLA